MDAAEQHLPRLATLHSLLMELVAAPLPWFALLRHPASALQVIPHEVFIQTL